MGLRSFTADLHIHSVLSPCGDYDMAPGPILEQAQKHKLDIIAITDHNSGANVNAFCEASRRMNIYVLPGMEVTTEEEAHVLTFFDTIEALMTWQAIVYTALPPIKNREELFGVQVEVAADNTVKKVNDRFLAGTTSLSIDTVVAQVNALGGMCIPAHVDKPGFSVIGRLGSIPPDLHIIGVEVYRTRTLSDAQQEFPDTKTYSVVRGSDAHYLQDVGSASTCYFIESPTIHELRKALLRQDGRCFRVDPL
ncbi:histidinol phosphatase [candidate division KSB3 bacterium]|uniref:Histidinol phosphatase n=1 Tax=candidate division KSB3 bacterium TaxID=2044937 RepID=A0A2G6E737_9BACT|nr:MAG: histidinol phosphatase [candidate division KSB3 bacterium]